ncbi:putative quinol monooxygenase [Streptomyces olivaceus]|uniref:putative quinol monooxygenase n=1 Tax=Streptomyces olivaceus TaxID=47716 RepID=UPI001CCE5FCA|nr:antibiotic biosynthesis monooxygenase [Streptomyces olivaceus]MBZ6084813.1 antibiotic biosynthesis monooxygenase [Streptomyces olivaceus]
MTAPTSGFDKDARGPARSPGGTAAARGAEIWAVARLSLRDGQLENFTRAAANCQERVSSTDTGTLRYEIHLSDDASEAVFVEGYRDVDALAEHNANLADLLPAMLGTGSLTAELFGHFSDEFRVSWAGESVRFFAPLP